MSIPIFTAELISALGTGEIISTGGGCEALLVRHRGVDYLVSDGDAGLPDGLGLYLFHNVDPDGESSCSCCMDGLGGIAIDSTEVVTDPKAWAVRIRQAMDADDVGRTERGLS